MYLHWNLLKECNFTCDYCCAHTRSGKIKELNIDLILKRLDRFNKTILATLTGGEVFLIPNFIEFVQELTKKHFVRIDTNLSLKKRCIEFIEKIDPQRVHEISFSVHVAEREKRGQSLHEASSLAGKFLDHGFSVVGNYVAYPLHLKRMPEDIKIFQDNGVQILPSMYVGRFNGKEYPVYKGNSSYNKDELNLIYSYCNHTKMVIDHKKGDFCHAGLKSFYINSQYQVFPCNSINKKIGDFWDDWNVFDKVIRCPQKFCGTPCCKMGFKSENEDSMMIKLRKIAIDEKKVASGIQSFLMTLSMTRLIKLIVNPVIDIFHMRGIVNFIKDRNRHQKNKK